MFSCYTCGGSINARGGLDLAILEYLEYAKSSELGTLEYSGVGKNKRRDQHPKLGTKNSGPKFASITSISFSKKLAVA